MDALPLLLCLLISWTLAQSIDGALSLSLSNPTVQQTSAYTFTVVLALNDPIPAGSILEMSFPNDYASAPRTDYPCRVDQWPFIISGAVSCSMANRVLTLAGAFTQDYEIVDDTVFQFVVSGISNPTYSGVTGQFSGAFRRPDSTLVVGIAQAATTIMPGSLTAILTVTPSIVSSTADLLVNITTMHSLPSGAWLRFASATNVWTRANSISPERIFSTTPSCHSVQNTGANLYCDYSTVNGRVLSVYNINPSINASAGATNFVFKVSTITTAPTTEPQGSFAISVLNPQSRIIDASSNNKIGGLEPTQILSPTLSLSSTTVGEPAIATISLRVLSLIQSTDTISIKFPDPISLSSLFKITAGSTQIPTYTIASNVLSFGGLQIVTSLPLTLTLENITNPGFVTNVSASGSTFDVWTARNGYKIDQRVSAFWYATTPGSINCTITVTGSTQAGVLSVYGFTCDFQHAVGSQHYLELALPAQQFAVTGSGTLACVSTLSAGCSISVPAPNVLRISGLVAPASLDKYMAVSFSLSNIRNPISVGPLAGFQASSYLGSGLLVDRSVSFGGGSITARQLPATRVTMSTTNKIVYAVTEITILINTSNPIAMYSRLQLQIPLGFDVSGLACTPFCAYVSSSATHTLHSLDISAFYVPGSAASIAVTLANIRNPKSTQPTLSFLLSVLNSQTNQQLEFLASGLQYRLCTEPTTLSVSLVRSSQVNSQAQVAYRFSLSLGFAAGQAARVRVWVPGSMGCQGCVVEASNGSHYQTSTVLDEGNGTIDLSPTPDTILLILANHYSTEPVTITLTALTLTNFLIASTTLTLSNSSPGRLSLTTAFVPGQQQTLSSTTTLQFLTLTPTYPSFSTLELVFGGQFNVSGAALVSGGNLYDLTVVSATVLRLSRKMEQIGGVMIGGLLTPAFTPSTGIVVMSYVAVGAAVYLVDSLNVPVVWSASCVLPCRTCSDLGCASCYSDPLLVASNVVLFTNTSYGACVTECPGNYFINLTTLLCQLCSPSCGNCINGSICTSCTTGLPYLLTYNSSTSLCYSQCPMTYYPSNISLPRRCLACSSTRHCLTCLDALSCASCQPGFYLHMSQCVPSCPTGITVQNEYAWICQSCPTNCSACVRDGAVLGGFAIKCTACLGGYLLDGVGCYERCVGFGLVPDPGTSTCRGCGEMCRSCQVDMYNCTSCNTSSIYRYFLLNRCLDSCPAGYYNDNTFNICMPCNAPCEFCRSASTSDCLTCRPGYALYAASICRSACPDGYYQNGSSCSQCPSACTLCSSPSVCLGCAQNFTLFAGQCQPECPTGYSPISRVCVQCSTNCLTCSVVNFCLTCQPGLLLHQGMCVSSCPGQYFINGSACGRCPYECSLCSAPSSCISCVSGYKLVLNGSAASCESLCQQGYVPVDGVCVPCDGGCRGCTYIRDNCTACTSGYYSYEAVTAGLYYLKCYSACPPSLLTYTIASKCLSECPQSTYPSTRECLPCPPLCLSCVSAGACTSCRPGSLAYQSLCYLSCPAPAPFNVSNSCRTCNVAQCFECAGVQCVQCNVPYLLIGGRCLAGCWEGTVYNQTTQTCDRISNNTNNSSNSTANTTTATISSLPFIPMPYAITGATCCLVVVAVGWALGASIYGGLFGAMGTLLQLSMATCLAVGTNAIANGGRLLQEGQVGMASTLVGRILIVVAVCLAISILTNMGVGVLYFCKVRTKVYRVVGVLSMVLGCKLMGALLCSNFYGVNMRARHGKQLLPITRARRKGVAQQQVEPSGAMSGSMSKITARLPRFDAHQGKQKISPAKTQQNIFSPLDSRHFEASLSPPRSVRTRGSRHARSALDGSPPDYSIQPIVHTPAQGKASSEQPERADRPEIYSMLGRQDAQQKRSSHGAYYTDNGSKGPQAGQKATPTHQRAVASILGKSSNQSSAFKLKQSSHARFGHPQPSSPEDPPQIEQYRQFFRLYNMIILCHVPVSIALMVLGVLLPLNTTPQEYLFYSGIELALLGLVDGTLAILWRWRGGHINHKHGQAEGALGWGSLSVIQEGKDESMADIREDGSTDGGRKIEPEQEIDSISSSCQLSSPAPCPVSPTPSKAYKSELGRPLDVVRLSRGQIPGAIEQGVYRESGHTLAERQHRQDMESDLESAMKFNLRRGQDGEPGQRGGMGVDGGVDEKPEDKQTANVIFQDDDEESLPTHGDEQHQDSSQSNKRIDSLGSQRHPQQTSRFLLPKQSLASHMRIVEAGQGVGSEDKAEKSDSNRLVNIFQGHYLEQEPARMHKRPSEWQNQRGRDIIYADLQSVGTVEQYQIQSQNADNDQLAIDPRPHDRHHLLQNEDEVVRPSTFINTDFSYARRPQEMSSMPRPLNPRARRVKPRPGSNINNK